MNSKRWTKVNYLLDQEDWKTLNMSMLSYFFDVEKKEENGKLFKDLYIEKTESFKEQGQYPVNIFIIKRFKSFNLGRNGRKNNYYTF